MTEPAIAVRGLRKTYRTKKETVHAVDGLDLEVARGEVFGLLGPNGAGKTTTVEICEGLLEPDAGDVCVLGMRWKKDDHALRARIGVTLQDSKFYDKQTVRELLELFRTFYDEPRPLDEVLALVSLEPKADTYFQNLSGGQRQRLAVACALVGWPDLLFLDEPTTGLDPQARRQLWDVVRAFRARGGTVLLTTHYMDEAAALCDRIMIVDHGKQIALGTPDALVRSLGAGHVVEVRADGIAAAVERFAAIDGVHESSAEGALLSLTVAEVHRALPQVLATCTAIGVSLEGLTLRSATLEDVFVHHTGRHLRDGGEG